MKFSLTKIINLSRKLDWIFGAMAAVPFAYPKEPFYLFAFVLLVLGGLRFSIPKKSMKDLILVLLFIICVAVINVLNDGYLYSSLGTCVAIVLFLFRYSVRSHEVFLKGFCFVTCFYAVATFAAYIFLNPIQKYGLNMFINSSSRMWAEGYLIEWPNVFCAFLVLGGIISWFFSNRLWSVLHFAASIITTSRVAYVGLLIVVVYLIAKGGKFIRYTLSGIVLAVIVYVLIILRNDELFLRYVTERLFKFSDRSLIYAQLFKISIENPFGIGNIPFEKLNEIYVSYHSSILKVLARYGYIGLSLFLFIIYPRAFFKNILHKSNLPIIFLFLCGIFQDFLFHSHFIILYSILLSYREGELKLNHFSRIS